MARPVYLQQRTFLVTARTAVECQNQTHAPQQTARSFDHLFGNRQQRRQLAIDVDVGILVVELSFLRE